MSLNMSPRFKKCCLLFLCFVQICRMPIAVFPGANYHARNANNSYLIVNVSSNGSSRDDYERFADVFTTVEAQLFDRTLAVLTTALRRANVTFFLNGGTLLGSYRHHGRIPWDYEADLIVEAGHRQRALAELNRCCVREFVVWMHDSRNSRMHFKFFPTAGKQVPGRHHRKPFIDIFSYAMNTTHVWNESPWFRRDWYLRRDVFPLRERPFGDLMLPAPCNTASALAVSYKVSECRQRNPTVVRPCTDRRLRDLHPFVTRSRWKAANGRMMVNETLVVGNRTLREVTLWNECYGQEKKT